jgi:hypothetical protein
MLSYSDTIRLYGSRDVQSLAAAKRLLNYPSAGTVARELRLTPVYPRSNRVRLTRVDALLQAALLDAM